MTWRLDGDAAYLQRGALAGQIALTRPWEGIGQLRLDEQPLPGYWAGAAIANADAGDATGEASSTQAVVEDAYVRGDDLVVVYEPLPTLAYRWQVYWRWQRRLEPAAATIDLILSVQTPLLDTRPVFLVGSRGCGGTAVRIAGAAPMQFLSTTTLLEHPARQAC